MFSRAKRKIRNYIQLLEFKNICQTCSLKLDWKNNSDDIETLREIFIRRSYADYFPFKQRAVIVDIGAHKGYFTLFASMNTAPSSRFICLEPAKENILILKNNLKNNAVDNCTIIPCAIYSQRGSVKLYPSKSVNYSVFDKSGLGADYEVPAITLGQLFEEQNIDRVDFLKMDCEGAEYPALLESDPATLRKIKTISMEFHDVKNTNYSGLGLVKFLENNGFKIVKFSYSPSVRNLNYGMLIATSN